MGQREGQVGHCLIRRVTPGQVVAEDANQRVAELPSLGTPVFGARVSPKHAAEIRVRSEHGPAQPRVGFVEVKLAAPCRWSLGVSLDAAVHQRHHVRIVVEQPAVSSFLHELRHQP